VASVLVGCPSGGEGEATPQEERIYSVAVEVADAGIVVDPVQVTGTIHPRRDVVIAAEGSGRVIDVSVALGDRVEKGTVLARLDSGVQRAQLDNARAGLRRSKALLALSEAGFKRSQALIEGAATTTSQHFAAGIDVESANAGVDAARAQLSLAERVLADAAIRAPFTGTIAALHIELGALVGAGTPAFRLVDLTRVVVSVGIPAREISRVEIGQPVAIHVPAIAMDVDGGTVTHIGPEPDPRTRSYPAEIEVDNAAGRLRSGMVARVDIVVAERAAVLVPEDAVVDDDPPHVFVIEDGIAHKHDVVLGRLVNGRYEARSGVKRGDRVATYGKQHLSDGVSVEPYDLPEATAAGEAASVELPAP
jgi:membrane fusion protein (multidrug efflux system)